MISIGMAIRPPRALPLTQQALSILSAYGADAHMWLPGAGYISGIEARNYLDSAGTTLLNSVTGVDQPVGLVLDAGKALGPELVASVTPQAGTFTSGEFTENTATEYHGIFFNAPSPANRTVANFRLKAGSRSWLWIYYDGYTAGSCWVNISTGALGNVEAGVSLVVTPSTDGYFNVTVNKLNNQSSGAMNMFAVTGNGSTATYLGTGSVAFQLSSYSVREVPGIHASQPTTANKPILRRGLVNLLLNSRTVMTGFAGWQGGAAGTINSADAPDGTVTASTVTAQEWLFCESADIPTGVYTFAIWLRAANGTSFSVSLGMNNKGSSTAVGRNTVVVTDTWQLFTVSGTTTAGLGVRVLVSNSGGGVNPPVGTNLWGAALFQGTVTAQQIIDAGGIPLTTTAPASSANGRYSWQFDGVNDSLNLGAPVFQMADDHFVCAGAIVNTTTVSALFGVGDGGVKRIAVIYSSGGVLNARWTDDAGLNSQPTVSGVSVGVPFVATAIKRGNIKTARLNGIAATDSTAVGVTSSTRADIGFASGVWHNGQIFPVIAIKGTVSDAQAKVLERFIGQLSGVTI